MHPRASASPKVRNAAAQQFPEIDDAVVFSEIVLEPLGFLARLAALVPPAA